MSEEKSAPKKEKPKKAAPAADGAAAPAAEAKPANAAQVVAQDAARNAMAHGLKEVQIRVSGPGLGRDSAIRGLQAIGLEISSIIDVTPVPHNGCRPRKRRRV